MSLHLCLLLCVCTRVFVCVVREIGTILITVGESYSLLAVFLLYIYCIRGSCAHLLVLLIRLQHKI